MPLDFSGLYNATDDSHRVTAGGNLEFHWATAGIGNEHIDHFASIVDDMRVREKFADMCNGERINIGEQRSVLHHLLRAQSAPNASLSPVWKRFRVENVRACELAEELWQEKRFDAVVHIGIGGSALGPELVMEALSYLPQRYIVRVVSNVDPQALISAMKGLNPERTLFLVVSKSGTTQETNANLQSLNIDSKKQVIAITTPKSSLDRPDDFLSVLYMEESIGGRYSISSPIGACIISLVYGAEQFFAFLRGMERSDVLCHGENITENAALLDAVLGVYYRNAREYPAIAVISYVHVLQRLSAYLQQLDMESNGKQSDVTGELVDYATGPIVFGEPGTDAQHSFFQFLHQGTITVPLQFVGMRNPLDSSEDSQRKQSLLNANLAAQMVALARGQENQNPNKRFLGGRPSTLLLADSLSAEVMGSIIAHFENKIMFQGFLWNINSFDQEGVQLGKRLTNQILHDPRSDLVLYNMARRIGLV